MDNVIVELTNVLLQAQTYAEARECVPRNLSGVSSCPATVFHPITAAFATQGYWIQAHLLWMIQNTGLQLWATLFYVVSAAGGIIGMAMGAPPKMWVWFLFGPGLFHWLVEDTVTVHGVRWNVGPIPTNDPDRAVRGQREVWKLAETGLLGSPLADATTVGGTSSFQVYGDRQPEGGWWGNGKVAVSNVFLIFDVLMSDVSDWLMGWTGVWRLAPSQTGTLSNVNAGQYLAQRAGQAGPDTDPSDDEHWMLTNLKWQTLQGITGATFNSTDLRESFATFMANECGGALKKSIDEGRFIMASSSRGANIPSSVMIYDSALNTVFTDLQNQYGKVTDNLAIEVVPTPPALERLLTMDGAGSFRTAVNYISSEEFIDRNILETIRCDQYLQILIHAIRWEAGHITYQLLSGLPAGIAPATMLYDLFYGWPIREIGGSAAGGGFAAIFNWLGFLTNDLTGLTPVSLSSERQARFFTNLVFIHLLRNEMLTVPTPYTPRLDSGRQTINNALVQMRTVGSVSKFGELYSWALLLPYVQGVMMYLLAMAYPFCCMLVVVPGWHKVIFTWLTFWAWVKLWDPGFAVVNVLERSIWAIIGNRSAASQLFSKVLAMEGDGLVQWSCQSGLTSIGTFPATMCSPSTVPTVYVGTATPTAPVLGQVFPGAGGVFDFQNWGQSLRYFDRSLAIGGAIDLDLSNGFYVQLMSALNFAVPAVMGQIVLGAKAGAASLATNAIGSAAGEAGRGAGGAFSSGYTARAQAGKTVADAESYYKNLRNDPEGLAEQAIGFGNSSLISGMESTYSGARNRGLGQQSRIASNYAQLSDKTLATAGSIMGTAAFLEQSEMAAWVSGTAVGTLGRSSSGSSGSSGSSTTNNRPQGTQAAGESQAPGSVENPGGQAAPPGGESRPPPEVVNPSGRNSSINSSSSTVDPRGLGQGLDGVSEVAKGAMNTMGYVNQNKINSGVSLASLGLARRNGTIQAQYDAMQSGEEGVAARHSAEQGMYQSASSAARGGAEVRATDGAYGDVMAGMMGNVGTLAAMGAQFSPVGTRAKSQEAAFNGYLGSQAKRASRYSNPFFGGHANMIAARAASYEADYGAEASLNRFSTGMSLQEAGDTIAREVERIPGGGLLTSAVTNMTLGMQNSLQDGPRLNQDTRFPDEPQLAPAVSQTFGNNTAGSGR